MSTTSHLDPHVAGVYSQPRYLGHELIHYHINEWVLLAVSCVECLLLLWALVILSWCWQRWLASVAADYINHHIERANT